MRASPISRRRESYQKKKPLHQSSQSLRRSPSITAVTFLCIFRAQSVIRRSDIVSFRALSRSEKEEFSFPLSSRGGTEIYSPGNFLVSCRPLSFSTGFSTPNEDEDFKYEERCRPLLFFIPRAISPLTCYISDSILQVVLS